MKVPEPPNKKRVDTPADIAIVVFFAVFAILVATTIFWVHNEGLQR